MFILNPKITLPLFLILLIGSVIGYYLLQPKSLPSIEIISNSTWLCTDQWQKDWQNESGIEEGWEPARAPWNNAPEKVAFLGNMGETEAQWMWHKDSPQTCYFRKTFHLNREPQQAVIKITADNFYDLYINGLLINSELDYESWYDAEIFDVTACLKTGANLIAVCASNRDGPQGLCLDLKINE